MARFEQSIIAVKRVVQSVRSDVHPHTVVHMSFQSMGSTNFQCINVLDKVGLYIRERNRGRDKDRHVCAIDMNEARELYFKLYGGVNKLDQQLKAGGG